MTSWKTTNFGTGTYSNSGNIRITEGNQLLLVTETSSSSTSTRVTIGYGMARGTSQIVDLTTSRGLMVTDIKSLGLTLANKASRVINVAVLYVKSNDTLSVESHRLEPEETAVTSVNMISLKGSVLLFW